MQVQIKRRFMILLDEDEAEEFLDDPTDVQTRVRDQLRNGHVPPGAVTTNLSSPPSSHGKGSAKEKARPNARGRRAMKRVPCPDCGKALPPGWLIRHRASHHNALLPTAPATARAATEPSVE